MKNLVTTKEPTPEDMEESARSDSENRRKRCNYLDKIPSQALSCPTRPIQGDVSSSKPLFQGRDLDNFTEDVDRTIDDYRSRNDRIVLQYVVEITTAIIALVRDRNNTLSGDRLRDRTPGRLEPRLPIPIVDQDITEATELISSEHTEGRLDLVYKHIWHELPAEGWD